MSKLLRSELKSIVKECLVEILSEGLSSKSNLNESGNYERQSIINSNNARKKTNKHISYLDKISYDNAEREKSNNIPIQNTNLTSDPILNSLLADTAKTTMQAQIAAESRKGSMSITEGADLATIQANNSTPEDLFGAESAGKWAKLAFFDQ